MTEATVANVALIVRVLLVGGILLALPRITRKGLLFGVYVGEEFAGGPVARRIRRSWDIGCLTVMATALLVGLTISVLGRPLTGNLTGTVVLLVAALVLYIRSYSRVRALAPAEVVRQAERATAFVQRERTRAEGNAKLVLAVCLLAALATLVYAFISYRAMPDLVPVPTRVVGRVESVSEKSLLATLYGPVLALVFGPLYAVLAWLTATAKRSLREGSDARAAAVQDAFRATFANVISGMALLMCALLIVYSVQRVRIALSQTDSLGTGIWWLIGALFVFLFVNLFRIMARYGQGGALIEGQPRGALTDGLADNAHWVLGMFYVDRDDPSLMVQKRFGIGFTMNYGNWHAVLITAAFTASLLAVVSLAFFL